MRSNRHTDVFPTLAVDPGATWVGICARVGTAAVDASTVGRRLRETDQQFVERTIGRVEAIMARHEVVARDAASGYQVTIADVPWRVAVEAVNKPKPMIRDRRTGEARKTLGANFAWQTAQLVGMWYAIMATYPGAVVVSPAHFDELHKPEHGGSGRLGDYWPPELIGRAPRRFTPSEGDRCHQRSAYTIAGEAFLLRPIPRAVAA